MRSPRSSRAGAASSSAPTCTHPNQRPNKPHPEQNWRKAMRNISTLQSLIGGRWLGAEAHTPLHSALNSQLIYHTHAEKIDFDEAVGYARKTRVRALMELDFQTRAARLKALATYLTGRKEELYEISRHTGATR